MSSGMSCRSCRSRPRGADIIDLDHYMRSAVKPHRHRDRRGREQLVVDAGGVDRAPRSPGPSSSVSDMSAPLAPRAPPARYSHDSGLSDGSYQRRRQKSHKRGAREAAGEAAQFRLACQRALREQQEQIARVAELCERLAQPAAVAAAPVAPVPAPAPVVATSDTTDSSSRSTQRHRGRRDRRRSQSCRTYEIIMRRLDELGRMFAARPPGSPRSPRAPRARSSCSVTVSDKLVATDPPPAPSPAPTAVAALSPAPTAVAALSPAPTDAARMVVVCRACTPAGPPAPLAPPAGDGSSPRGSLRSRRAAAEYDLADPIHLYEQAKQLQSQQAGAGSTRRSPRADHSQRCEDTRTWIYGEERSYVGAGEVPRKLTADERLCAACRCYWRAVCRGLALLFAPRTAT